MERFITKFESGLLKYGLAAILIAVPLYPKFPFISVPGTYVSIRLEDFLIAAIFVVWTISLLRRKKSPTFPKPLLIAVLIYLFASAVSSLSSVLVTHTALPHIALLHWLRRVEYLIPLFVAASVIKSQKDMFFYLEVLFWTTVAIVGYGLGQIYLEWPVISTQNYEFAKGFALRLTPGARLNSTFAGHYDLAAFSVIMAPIFLAMFVAPIKKYYKIIGLVGLSLVLWLLLASSSRISFPSYLFAGTVFLWFSSKKRLLVAFLILSLGLMSTTTELASRYLRTLDVYLKPLASLIVIPRKEPTEPPYQIDITSTPAPEKTDGLTGDPIVPAPITPIATPTRRPKLVKTITPTPAPVIIIEERSTQIRLNAEWPRALRAFYKNPLLGTGFSSITLATDNDYLRLLGELGILGFISFFSVLIALVTPPLKKLASKSDEFSVLVSRAIIAGILGFAINATFIDVFEASKAAIIFWAVSGILVSINHEKK